MGVEKDMMIFRFGTRSVGNEDWFGTIKVNLDSIMPSDQVFKHLSFCDKMRLIDIYFNL